MPRIKNFQGELALAGPMSLNGNLVPSEDGRWSVGLSNRRISRLYVKELVVDSITSGTASASGTIGDADTVDGIHASTVRSPNKLYPLNSGSVYPISVYDQAVLIDGTRELTADWDAGEYIVRAHSLRADGGYSGYTEVTQYSTGGNIRSSAGSLTLHGADNFIKFTGGLDDVTFEIKDIGDLEFVVEAGAMGVYPYGDIVVDPGGNDILPLQSYQVNLGSLQNKYLTGHFAELWIDKLVAHETLSTVGGRILVMPTTSLTRDIAPSDTTIYVEHNNLQIADTVLLEGRMKVEFIYITSAPANGIFYSEELHDNADFEDVTANDFAGWTEVLGDGDIYSVTGAPSGVYSCVLESGVTKNTSIYQGTTVIPAETYKLRFLYWDEGTYGVGYRIKDQTHDADIVAQTFLSPVGDSWTTHTEEFVIPSGCVIIRIYFYCPHR